jgi:hypothetical protein
VNQASPAIFAEMQARTLEAVTVWNDMNHRVLQELVGLSAAAAKESMRTYAELQATATDAVRGLPGAAGTAEGLGSPPASPFAWYQRGLVGLIEGTQKSLRLLEANAQAVTRSAERLQASADRTGQEVHEALESSAGRIKDIFGRP